MMLIKKKKLLNVRYKRTPESKRLLDKQFSLNDKDRFRISVKDKVFYFMRPDEQSGYQITNGKSIKGIPVNYGKSVRVDHPDGTAIYFTLHEDFLYSLDYDKWTYGALALCVNVIFFALLQFLMPMMGSDIVELKQQKEVEQKQRVGDLLKKIEEKKIAKVEPTPAPTPEVTAAPTPEPTPIAQVTPEPVSTPRQKPQVTKKLERETLDKKPHKKTVVTKEANPPKRLVVQKGPMVVGGTGPKNPNAKTNTAAQSQAKALAMTTAKVSSALGFLAKGKGIVNVPPNGSAEGSPRYIGSQGLAGAKNSTGKNFLSKITGKDVVGGNSGPINTSGSRTIASGAVISDGEVNGSPNGKALNYVQGKVSVSGLHAAGGSGSFGAAMGGMSVKGSIDEDAVRAAIEKNMSKIRYCYEKSLLRKPSLQGALKMTWQIRPGGSASGVSVASSALNDSTLHSCVSSAIAKISFPSPKGGPATVSYPFDFKPFQ